MTMYIVDRLEEMLAVIEVTESDDTTHYIKVNRDQLPSNVQEGDMLVHNDDVWQIDVQATQKRREKMKQRFQKLKSI